MPKIVACASALPAHYYSQAELVRALVRVNGVRFEERVVARFFRSVGVEGRHLALELERYFDPGGFGKRNDAFIEVGLQVAESAVQKLCERTQIELAEIGLFASTTVTGIAVPSLEARLMNRLPFSPATKRLPLFGLGCVAGAAGIARLSDYLQAYPKQAALLVSVELCSLTFQPDDLSTANVIATGLFGDGAAAVLLVGDEHPLANGRVSGRQPSTGLANGHPRVLDTRSVLFPDTERVMGWDVVDSGFRIVLDTSVPELARTALPRAVRDFLYAHRLAVGDIDPWIAHPGGPAVIDGMERGLELPAGALAASRESLARIGNLSSASVLIILEQALEERARKQRASTEGRALLLAMGPGFCAELVLLSW
jgi:alkylresorcinol/alkylpyrone synthase